MATVAAFGGQAASDGPRLRRKVVNLAPREAVTRGQRSANVHNVVEGILQLRSIADVRENILVAQYSLGRGQPTADQLYHCHRFYHIPSIHSY